MQSTQSPPPRSGRVERNAAAAILAIGQILSLGHAAAQPIEVEPAGVLGALSDTDGPVFGMVSHMLALAPDTVMVLEADQLRDHVTVWEWSTGTRMDTFASVLR
jgi:hypothetical protein